MSVKEIFLAVKLQFRYFMKVIFQLYLIAFFILIFSHVQASKSLQCESFYRGLTAAEAWAILYKKSDHEPRPELWLKIRQSLEKNVIRLHNPMDLAGSDPNQVAAVYKSMRAELPILGRLLELDNEVAVSHSSFVKLKRDIVIQILDIAKNPRSHLQVFSALEALKVLSSLESKVEFPRIIDTNENKFSEKEKPEDIESFKPEPKDYSELTRLEDTYVPTDRVESNSKSKKPIRDLVLTNASLIKGLLRQKIYDNFDLVSWHSTPVVRNKSLLSKTSTRELIVHPPRFGRINVPIPYGYSFIPTRGVGYKIDEKGPGEFRLASISKDPIKIDLREILEESVSSTGISRIDSSEIIKNMPAHLVDFTHSLRGLTPLEAAAKLEKYISEDGGFLYAATGDKIDQTLFGKLRLQLNTLLKRMPKPMALAQLGVFKCDGAAWIGGLLLRDVLGHKVRLAGGHKVEETSKREIDGGDFSVLQSGQPGHAWVEVYDGKKWVPFDMTPKNNKPAENPDDKPASQKNQNSKKDQKAGEDSKDSKGNDQSNKGSGKDNKPQEGNGEGKKSERVEPQQSKPNEGKNSGEKKGAEVDKEAHGKSKSRDEIGRRIGSKANDTPSSWVERYEGALVERIANEASRRYLENLLVNGTTASRDKESHRIFKELGLLVYEPGGPLNAAQFKNTIVTADHHEYVPLKQIPQEIFKLLRERDFKNALWKIHLNNLVFQYLADLRPLTPHEVRNVEILNRVSAIIKRTTRFRPSTSDPIDLVENFLSVVKGAVSREWLRRNFGEGYDQPGTKAYLDLADSIPNEHNVAQLEAISKIGEFVEFSLDSYMEPKYAETPTSTKSILPTQHKGIAITRDIKDFARMIFQPRPGEHLFAPTLQGRQFAVTSVETERTRTPQITSEKKVTFIYQDMTQHVQRLEHSRHVDSLVLNFLDKAFTEVDVAGNPNHEIYFVEFGQTRGEAVRISTQEEALNFFSRKKVVAFDRGVNEPRQFIEYFEDFVEIISSVKEEAQIEKKFQSANMILFTNNDGPVNFEAFDRAKRDLPNGTRINLNVVALGRGNFQDLRAIAEANHTVSGAPAFRTIDLMEVEKIFSSVRKKNSYYLSKDGNFNLTEATFKEIQDLFSQLQINPLKEFDKEFVVAQLNKIEKAPAKYKRPSSSRNFSELEEFVDSLRDISLGREAKQQIVESIVRFYPNLTRREWHEMTQEEVALMRRLRSWAQL